MLRCFPKFDVETFLTLSSGNFYWAFFFVEKSTSSRLEHIMQRQKTSQVLLNQTKKKLLVNSRRLSLILHLEMNIQNEEAKTITRQMTSQTYKLYCWLKWLSLLTQGPFIINYMRYDFPGSTMTIGTHMTNPTFIVSQLTVVQVTNSSNGIPPAG